jgi:hypothetical protein
MAGRPRGREEVVPLMYEDEAARPRFGHREGGLQVQQQRRAGGGGAGEDVGEGRAGGGRGRNGTAAVLLFRGDGERVAARSRREGGDGNREGKPGVGGGRG